MASNADSNPDPDAAARRRSGRVVKAPDRLAPEPSVSAAKRKRDGADEEDDAENDVPELDDDESDEPDDESDDETPARKSRKAQSKRARKPASKKPKINGTQPSAKRTMTLPRMPKKPVRLDTDGKSNALYSTAPARRFDPLLT